MTDSKINKIMNDLLEALNEHEKERKYLNKKFWETIQEKIILIKKLEAIKTIHDRLIDFIIHHREKKKEEMHWSGKRYHSLQAGSYSSVLHWIRTEVLDLCEIDLLKGLTENDKILEGEG